MPPRRNALGISLLTLLQVSKYSIYKSCHIHNKLLVVDVRTPKSNQIYKTILWPILYCQSRGWPHIGTPSNTKNTLFVCSVCYVFGTQHAGKIPFTRSLCTLQTIDMIPSTDLASQTRTRSVTCAKRSSLCGGTPCGTDHRDCGTVNIWACGQGVYVDFTRFMFRLAIWRRLIDRVTLIGLIRCDCKSNELILMLTITTIEFLSDLFHHKDYDL